MVNSKAGMMNLVMKKKRRGTGTALFFFSTDYTYGYTTGYLGLWLSLRRGENIPASSAEDDDEDAEDGLHRGL